MITAARAAYLLPYSRQNLARLVAERGRVTNARRRAALDKQIENVAAAIARMEKMLKRGMNE